jgi:hypothetical protein
MIALAVALAVAASRSGFFLEPDTSNAFLMGAISGTLAAAGGIGLFLSDGKKKG